MITINVQQAKTHLSDLLARVQQGEEIVIARAGTPVARLVPVQTLSPRQFGGMALEVPEDFDAPLDEAELAAWE